MVGVKRKVDIPSGCRSSSVLSQLVPQANHDVAPGHFCTGYPLLPFHVGWTMLSFFVVMVPSKQQKTRKREDGLDARRYVDGRKGEERRGVVTAVDEEDLSQPTYGVHTQAGGTPLMQHTQHRRVGPSDEHGKGMRFYWCSVALSGSSSSPQYSQRPVTLSASIAASSQSSISSSDCRV